MARGDSIRWRNALQQFRKSSDELPADFDVVLLDEVSPAIGEVSTDDETAEARGAMLAWAEVVPVAQAQEETTLAMEMNLDLVAHELEVESRIQIQGGAGTEMKDLCPQRWNNVTKDTRHVPSWNNSLFNIGVENNKYVYMGHQVRRLLAVAGTTNLTIVELESTSGKLLPGRRLGPGESAALPLPHLPYPIYMEIPQELIDAIIDNFPLRLDSISDLPDPETKRTLQSCALVSRSFLQCCQMRLFSRISVGDSYLPTFPLACQRLAAVLSSSTHLAGYIQTLELVYDADDSVLVEFFPRILSAVTAVETLQLVRHIDADMWYFPPFDSSMITVFSLPSLRRLELCDWCFRNSLELQALLNRSASLQELTLHNVSFEEVENDSETVPPLRRGTYLVRNWSWSDWVCPPNSLLRANAGSLQKLRIGLTYRDAEFEIDPDVLTSANYLSSIELDGYSVERIALPLLPYKNPNWAFALLLRESTRGSRTTLGKSRCISIHIYGSYENQDGMAPQNVEDVKRWLPLVSSSGRLHVYSKADRLPLKIY
ncbi:hypothetical protein B0H14DRAFT_3150411 [Mycena olivaceomarginata]|nr:hypothetical protein B0H14DRAFT_3150411 [Mycena olivaceomarginata]